MSDQNKCREISELLPLYYNSGLEKKQAEALRSHLEVCSDCRDAYSKERVLFAIAGSEAATDLDSHFDAGLLDIYARDPNTVSGSQRSELERHLSTCQLCAEAVEKLTTLPRELDDLLSAENLPLIAKLDHSIVKSSTTTTIIDLKRRLWKPMTAIAAAAVIIIVGVTMMTYHGSEPSARVEGTFPVATRSVSPPTVFETETESFTFVGRIYVDPEKNHDYSIMVRDVALDSLILHIPQLTTFDSLGFANLELVMSPGKYELILYDILDTDSLRITRPFDIRMKH